MAMKPTKRKAFSFLRSYFDALNEIPEDKDKLDFLISIINKQFLDEDPVKLNLIAKLSYEGQRHAIEKSVKGYKDKMKTDLLGNPIKDPLQPPRQGGAKPRYKAPLQQEKEEEQDKEELTISVFNKESKNYKMYANRLFTDIPIKERFYKNHLQVKKSDFIKIQTWKKYVGLFLDHVLNEFIIHNSYKSYSIHFSRWLNKQEIELFSNAPILKLDQH